METIKVEITMDRLQKAVESSIESILKNDYSNPVRTAVESAIKEQNGPIQEFVTSVISDVLTKPEFKAKMGEVVLTRLLEATMKGR